MQQYIDEGLEVRNRAIENIVRGYLEALDIEYDKENIQEINQFLRDNGYSILARGIPSENLGVERMFIDLVRTKNTGHYVEKFTVQSRVVEVRYL
jgi:hypothetical protein